ncbi:MAG: N-acetylmuramoyl-L-alanine amidase [Clostridia bacterium]|nr:N-acetylmuramoyl-L-alanine amidase [Clostridia bacterium]
MDTDGIRRDKGRIARFMAGLILFIMIFAAASYFIAVVMTNHFSEITEGRPFIDVSADESLPMLVIDPGHGGEDGGASSGEVLEKDLNLSVSEDIYYLCVMAGIPAKMTRRTDTALYDLYGDLADYSGKKKTYDLTNRVKFVKENDAAIYLGVHMNKFPRSEYKGLQVYYSPNAKESEELAGIIQSAARRHIDPENSREIKRATKSIFVLDRLSVPAVLVECGFLSNPGDLEALCDPSYRLHLAAVITSAVASYECGEAGY